VLGEQGRALAQGPALEAMHEVKAMGAEVAAMLATGDVDAYAGLLQRHWRRKRQMATSMTDPAIDALHQLGLGAGAASGKLLGAGGGGFFLFFVPVAAGAGFDRAMSAAGRTALPVRFSTAGARAFDC
jgi:D-glycero-alpha-D-manno-heptose-7-phosphate kinase